MRACFWELSNQLRSHLVRSLYEAARAAQQEPIEVSSSSSSGSETQHRRPPVEWQLCGRRVCFANFAHLLGTTQRSILKSIRGEIDGRQLRASQPFSAHSQTVDFFFYELYQSAGALALLEHS